MQYLPKTLETPEENIALDEALLDYAEISGAGSEYLRIWEPQQHFIVLGRSSRVALEINETATENAKCHMVRRSSGGASVVAGPGCLMYAVVLSYEKRPDIRPLDQSHAFVLGRNVHAFNQSISGVKIAGTSDLVLERDAAICKFSGNSLRCKRSHLLYHGTILYDFDITMLSNLLLAPPKQPAYRSARAHDAFVTNLPIDRESIIHNLIKVWQANEVMQHWPASLTQKLVKERYATTEWTRCF